MANPILTAMLNQQVAGALGPVKQLMQTVKMAQDPQAALTSALQNNPNYQQAMHLINQAGGDPVRAFQNLAKQNGIDPETILRNLT